MRLRTLAARAVGTVTGQKPQEVEMGITYITQDEIVRRVTEAAQRAGLTFDEFMAEGKAGTLTDGDLRDHWLIYGDLIES